MVVGYHHFRKPPDGEIVALESLTTSPDNLDVPEVMPPKMHV